MELTRAGDYGFLGILYLAKQPEKKVVRLSEISENEDIPEKFLAKIFQSYTRSGLVKSYRGARGGFSMAKSPAKITAKDILECVQGPIYLTRCLRVTPPANCRRHPYTTHSLRSAIRSGHETLNLFLEIEIHHEQPVLCPHL